jgi:DNA helicase IV
MADYSSQIRHEQHKVDEVYARVDEMMHDTRRRLGAVRARGGKGSPTEQAERDSFNAMYEDRLTQLRAVQDRLVFGRIDGEDGDQRYIGRIGVSSATHEPMLTDWRAEAARPFYEATPRNRMGIVLRRHIALRFRQVTGVEDEVLNVSSDDAKKAQASGTLTGEGALLTSLATRRTGQMTDIVATIQAEQDRIIRQPLAQVTIVQGGPGTGKTAVALHRAAYLLYTNRRRLSHSGVLIIGPSPAFLHYIGQVLPSLGETGVLSRTIGTLLPGITATGTEDPRAARIKGDERMATAVRNAVRLRIRVPKDLPTLRVGRSRVYVRLTADDIRSVQDSLRRTRKTHNEARIDFVNRVLDRLVDQYRRQMHDVSITAEDLADVREDLRLDTRLQRALNKAWLPLTATWLIENLWANPRRLAQAAPWLDEQERRLLYRPKGSAWTASDIPLLDEAMELIGPDPDKAGQPAKKTSEAERFAQQTLEQLGMAGNGLVSAKQLAGQMDGSADERTLQERAAADRQWTFGHIVVDEAQELTRMDWRMLLRRCPSRSLTIVGDVAQTSALGGARRWEDMLDPVFGAGRWKKYELTIDYRNPQEVASLAERFARDEGLYVSTVHSVRQMPDSLSLTTLPDVGRLIETAASTTADLAAQYLASDGTGRIAVVADDSLLTMLRRPLWQAVSRRLGEAMTARLRSQPDWDDQIDIVDPESIKGLEYDAVVLVEPGLVMENGASRASAASDLYVAMTRPTQRLVILRTQEDSRRVSLG